ncbi:TPA: hypothetical protein MCA50_004413 [Klebsiella pneumoniae]|nr:hypothetical protein [Klebsiella pneumoniae]
MVNGSGLAILREFQALALFRSHLQLKIYKLVFTYYEDIHRYPVTHLFNTVYVGLPDDRDTQESSVSCQRNHCEHARTGAVRHLYSTGLHRDSGMRKITLLLAALSFSLLADTRIYQCDMTVSQVKNDQIGRPTKADFGALVVDSGEQFYVVRGDEVLSSPYLAKRNGKLVGVGEDKLIYNKSHDVYGVHSKDQSFFFDGCKEVG